jgi:heterodisulfide reductase subunit B
VARAFAYYPGCSLRASAREYDVSTRAVFSALGFEVREIEGWVCCGASSAHATDQLLALTLPAHELQAAAQMGMPMLVPCAMCYSRLKLTLLELEKPGVKEEVEKALGKPLEKMPAVLHPLEVLGKEEIPVKRPLGGLKVACYYGCLLVRPQGVVPGEDLENPQGMDHIMARLGAQPVPWPFKNECCGASMFLPKKDLLLRLSRRIVLQAREAGAEALVVGCPMCHFNLDLAQKDTKNPLPVLYITQAVGLALGLSPRELLLKRHIISPLALLKGKGIIGG